MFNKIIDPNPIIGLQLSKHQNVVDTFQLPLLGGNCIAYLYHQTYLRSCGVQTNIVIAILGEVSSHHAYTKYTNRIFCQADVQLGYNYCFWKVVL